MAQQFTKNARGYYQTGVMIGYTEDGRPKRKWLYAKTTKELKEKIDTVKQAIRAGANLLDEDEIGRAHV